MIAHIVAMDKNNCIGGNNELLWNVPLDMKYFKLMTTGKTVVMGRKTYESIGKPLPNRTNYVLSSKSIDGVNTIQDINQLDGDFIVIGGAQVYADTLDNADILLVTHLDLEVNGDSFYPEIPSRFTKTSSTKLTCSVSGVECEFAIYEVV